MKQKNLLKNLFLIIGIVFTMNAFSQATIKVTTGTSVKINEISTKSNYNNAWAVGEGGFTLFTTDKGSTWNNQTPNTTQNLNGVYFEDVNNGWIAGDSGVIRYTSNGGITWNSVSLTSLPNYEITGITTTRNDSVIWISTGNGDGNIYKSLDGGVNWLLASVGNTTGFNDIVSFTNNTIIANYKSQISGANNGRRTIDGGNVWNNIQWNGTINSISGSTATVGWGAYSQGVRKTIDAGFNFNTFYTISDYNSVCHFGPDTIVIAGTNGKAFISIDKGANWNSISSFGTSLVYDIKCSPVNSRLGFASAGSSIYKTTNGGATWTSYLSQSISCTPNYFPQISFVHPDTLFACYNRTGCNGNGTYRVYKLHNLASATPLYDYKETSNPNSNIKGITMPNLSRFWVTAMDSSFGSPIQDQGYYGRWIRLKTPNDSAKYWKVRYFRGPQTTSRISAINSFPYDTNLLIVGYENGKVYKSIDASTAVPTWTEIVSAKNPNNLAVNKFFYDSVNKVLWYVGTRYVMRSTDNANNWDTWTQVGDPSGSDIVLSDISIKGNSAVISGPTNSLFISNNAQDATPLWTKIPQSKINSLNGILNSVTGVSANANYAYAVGDSGLIIKTFNGGTSWKNVTVVSVKEKLKAIAAIDTINIIAVGNNGTILRTVNGGISWTNPVSGTINNFNDIIVKGSNAYAVGDTGTIAVSADSGKTWSIVPTVSLPSTRKLLDGYFITPTTGFVCGAGGTFLKTSDGGSTWVKLYSKENFTDICDTKNNTATYVYACTKEGGVYVSNNSGLNFNKVLYSLNSLTSIHGYASNTNSLTDDRIIVGGNTPAGIPVISRSNNSGVSFTTITNPSGIGLKKINDVFWIPTSADYAFAVGDSGLIIKYRNADDNTIGNILKAVITSPVIPSYLKLNSVFFADTNNGVIVADSGYVFKTTDSGKNWTIVTNTNLSKENLLCVFDKEGNTLSGANGLIIYPNPTSTCNVIDDENELSVYPNPCSSIVNIISKNGDLIEISDVNNKLIISELVTENGVKTINVGNLNKGLYIVKLIETNSVKTGIIIKE